MPKRKDQRDWIDFEPIPEARCALCDREFGEKIEKHHVIPKSRGGKETVQLHPICHRKIHRRFTNRELEQLGSLDPVVVDEEMVRFIKWLKNKPANFYKPTR